VTRYAHGTAVPVERSRGEVERLIAKYGGDRFVYGQPQDNLVVVGFRMRERFVRMDLPLPERAEAKRTPTGKVRKSTVADQEFERLVKQRWRALVLIIKAKLEAVESGVSSFDQEWLPYFVLPGGVTVYQKALPEIEAAYKTGKVQQGLLLGMGANA
jgi:hypothetical protein